MNAKQTIDFVTIIQDAILNDKIKKQKTHRPYSDCTRITKNKIIKHAQRTFEGKDYALYVEAGMNFYVRWFAFNGGHDGLGSYRVFYRTFNHKSQAWQVIELV